MNTSFAVNAIKKSLLLILPARGDSSKKNIRNHYINPAQPSYYLTLPCVFKLVGDGGKTDAASVGQRGMVQKLVKMEKIPTSSKGIMQAFADSRKHYNPKSRKQLTFEDDTIILFVEAYNPLFVVERASF